MNNKYLIAAVVLTVAITSFTACGKTSKEYIEPSSVPTASVSPDPSMDGENQLPDNGEQQENGTPSAAPSATATPKPTAKPNAGSTTAPTQKPSFPVNQATPQPTQAPTQKPVQPSASLSSVMTKMLSVLPAGSHNMSELPSELYAEVYGIDPSQFEDVLVYGSMMNVKANEVILIKAKDSASLNTAVNLLQKRKATLKSTWEHYLQDQYELVQASVIKTSGNYAALIVTQDVNNVASAFVKATK